MYDALAAKWHQKQAIASSDFLAIVSSDASKRRRLGLGSENRRVEKSTHTKPRLGAGRVVAREWVILEIVSIRKLWSCDALL
jgi:hypothetical protein